MVDDVMNILLRVDGYPEIGGGHVTRSLALANGFRTAGHQVFFAIERDEPTKRFLRKRGYNVLNIFGNSECAQTIEFVRNNDIKVYISDISTITNYVLDSLEIEGVYRTQIDINRDFSLNLNLLVNGGIYAESLDKEASKANITALLGPSYSLLREEFAHASTKIIRDNIDECLVVFGASDIYNLTEKIIYHVCPNLKQILFHIITSHQLSSDVPDNVKMYQYVDNIDELMKSADLAIAAGGVSQYELAAIGTPSIIITQADNQLLQSDIFSSLGITLLHGSYENFDPKMLIREFNCLNENPSIRRSMSEAGRKHIDGKGVHRVVKYILENYDDVN